VSLFRQQQPQNPGLRVVGEVDHVVAQEMGEVLWGGVGDCVVGEEDGAFFVEEGWGFYWVGEEEGLGEGLEVGFGV